MCHSIHNQCNLKQYSKPYQRHLHRLRFCFFVFVAAKDCVLLRRTGAIKPIIARVEKIEQDNSNRMRVYVRRYYRPEETIEGRVCFHGDKELFLSNHYDVHSADTIEGKCFVHTLKNYMKLEVVGANDYFSRFWYNAFTGAMTPERVEV